MNLISSLGVFFLNPRHGRTVDLLNESAQLYWPIRSLSKGSAHIGIDCRMQCESEWLYGKVYVRLRWRAGYRDCHWRCRVEGPYKWSRLFRFMCRVVSFTVCGSIDWNHRHLAFEKRPQGIEVRSGQVSLCERGQNAGVSKPVLFLIHLSYFGEGFYRRRSKICNCIVANCRKFDDSSHAMLRVLHIVGKLLT